MQPRFTDVQHARAGARFPLSAAALLLSLLASACSEPPRKELDLAQGAIDAARAAGAEQYATPQFTAATGALQQAHDAVAQRDYRLALTRALDAHDRAQDAAKGAADGKAQARSQAEAAINTAFAALQRLRARLSSVTLPKRTLDAARRDLRNVEAELQKARAQLNAGGYLDARDAAASVGAQIAAQMKGIDAAEAARPARPTRRRG